MRKLFYPSAASPAPQCQFHRRDGVPCHTPPRWVHLCRADDGEHKTVCDFHFRLLMRSGSHGWVNMERKDSAQVVAEHDARAKLTGAT